MKLCECGCGQPTRLATKTSREKGYVKGEPVRFIKGHHARLPEIRAKIGAAGMGRVFSPERNAKVAAAKRGELNVNWKGDEAGALSIHRWLNVNHPRSGVCEDCGSEGKTDYAYQKHPEPYTRNPEDYREQCRRCHMESDGRLERLILARKRRAA